MSTSPASEPVAQVNSPGRPRLLLVSVFVVATCGLVYELIAGTLASYLLGDSVLQFSTVIGDYLFAMGVGSYLAQYFSRRNPVVGFVRLQILIGLIGGSSAAIMHLAFSYSGGFRVVLYALVFLVGLLVGVEIPLLMEILKKYYGFRELVSQVLCLDYIGALVASLLFPLLLVPYLGLLRTSFVCGILNVCVALSFYGPFPEIYQRFRSILVEAVLALLLLVAGLVAADELTSLAEEALYSDPVIMTRQSHYQRLVVTRHNNDIRLYLNGNLQFSSMDEYRYHESLVHPTLCAHPKPSQVLVLGGGDGLAVRELLKDSRVESITLVDLDPEMLDVFRHHPLLTGINKSSLSDPRVHLVNADAFVWLQHTGQMFDLAIVDFPDPSNYSVGKLYTTSFYKSLGRHLNPHGIVSVQSTSPLFARRSYWCVVRTMAAAGFQVRPYHVYVPSFGEWGFALGALHGEAAIEPSRLISGLRFLTASGIDDLFRFPADMGAMDAPVNRLFDQVLVRCYEQDWRRIVE